MFKTIWLLFLGFISFSAAAANQVTASWSAPSVRESGQALPADEIGGYQISYDCGEPKAVVIDDGTATEFIFSDLPAGNCSFSIAAFDSNGIMGADSAVVEITIGDGPAPPVNFNATSVSIIPATVQACMDDPSCKVAVQGEWQ